MNDGVLSDLIDLLYGAATEAKRWPDFLSRLADVTDSAVTLVMARDVANPGCDLLWYFGPGEAEGAWARWAEANLTSQTTPPRRMEAALARHSTGAGRCFPSVLFEDKANPQRAVADPCGLSVFHQPPLSTVLGCNRPAPDYGPREHALLQTLSPHLPRAVSIFRRLGRAELERASSQAALDVLSYGVLFVDERGRALLYNRAARAVFDDGDGLSLSAQGILCAEHCSDRATLHRLVVEACETGSGGIEPNGGALPVRRPSHKRPYSVIVSPLRLRAWSLLSKRPAAAVFVTDPEHAPEIPQQHLTQLFGLTPAEARLAAALAGRRTVQEYAERTGVTAGTARWTLKRVLEKTGCSRQSELVLLLISALGAVLF